MTAGLSLFLGLWIFASVAESTNEKYPFFPHSIEDEQRIIKLVDKINSANLPWKAEYNPHASLVGQEPLESASGRLSTQAIDSLNKEFSGDTWTHMKELAQMNLTLPQSFDARDKWSRCSSIHHIQNQGGCGSCWAAASVSVMSDRLCISSNYSVQHMISLQDLVSCCDYCGDCNGGQPSYAFLYWKKTGIVSGSSLGSNEGCRPYEVESTCGVPCPTYFYKTSFNPKCVKTCSKMYGKIYKDDLKKGKSIYLIPNGEVVGPFSAQPLSRIDLIKREIMTHGPVVVAAHVSEPFAHYRSGIYTKTTFDYEGHENLDYGHAMRIIGWGSENGVEYWTIANSWGRQWGENGFGRLSVDYPIWEVVAGLW